jgi:hypothetical protein
MRTCSTLGDEIPSQGLGLGAQIAPGGQDRVGAAGEVDAEARDRNIRKAAERGHEPMGSQRRRAHERQRERGPEHCVDRRERPGGAGRKDQLSLE